MMTKEQIQSRLHALNYYGGAIDGIIGPVTRAAIMAFQKSRGLVVDGIAGPKTQAALQLAATMSPAPNHELDARSERNLRGVHPDLVAVMREAIRRHPVKATITEGLRTLERQRKLLAAGASRTLRSRHLTGHAVDVVFIMDRRARWDWPLYKDFADTVKAVAKEKGIRVVWGGDWRTFKDGPHFELYRKDYPG